MGKVRQAVYSVLVGGYENLQEQPMARDSEVPFILLTDDPALRSDTWDVRLITPAFTLDPVRSARSVKLLGADDLAEYTETLWIDNRVELLRPPEELLGEWLSDADLTLPFHSFRETLVDEFSAVVTSGYDDPTRVYEQLIHYGETRPEALAAKPLWTGILARRVNPEVNALMRTWMDHVLRYSRRDQLSLPYLLGTAGVRWHGLELDNLESPWHRWPLLSDALGRRSETRHIRFENTIQAPLARLRIVEEELAEARTAVEEGSQAATAADAALAEVSAELATARAERDAAVAEVEHRRGAWDRLVQERTTAESEATRLARELDAAVTRRDRAEAAVTAMRHVVAQTHQGKREAIETYRAKLIHTRGQVAAAKADLARIKRSRAYKMARRTASAIRRLKPGK